MEFAWQPTNLATVYNSLSLTNILASTSTAMLKNVIATILLAIYL
jgi:hypothetical protein